jgi:hypothetical protein
MAVETASPTDSEPRVGNGGRRPRRWRSVVYGGLLMPLLTTVVGAALVANFVTSRLDAQQANHTRQLELRAQVANEIATSTVSFITQDEVMVEAANGKGAVPENEPGFFAHLEKFEAATTLIEAKLAAYYPTRSLEATWNRLESALLDYDRLGTDIVQGGDDLEDDVTELKIDLGQVASHARIQWDALAFPRGPNVDPVQAYLGAGSLLIKQATELTREALT